MLTLLQHRLYKTIQIAIHHPLHIRGFKLRAVIFDHRIRVKHVGTNLAAEISVHRLAPNRAQLCFMLSDFSGQQL